MIRGNLRSVPSSLMALVVAAIVVACSTSPAPLVVERGWGTFDTAAFTVPVGRYVVRWQATDEQQPRDGCSFGLHLQLIDDPIDQPERGQPTFRVPKIAYEALPAASSRDGSSGPLELRATTYRFRSEGSCVWQAWIEPAPLVIPEDENEPDQRIVNQQAIRR